MQSPYTGKEMKLLIKPSSIIIRKEAFTVMHHVWQCIDTKEEFEFDVDGTIRQAEDQYRSKHNLPFQEEIKAIREQYDISAAKMSEVLRFGINQYKQYENGELPSESNASLIFLARDPKGFCQLVELSNIVEKEKVNLYKKAESLLEKNLHWREKVWAIQLLMGEPHPNVERGFKPPSLEKFGSMVQFFAVQMTPFKTQLNKLLFYSDFVHFKHFGRSISGSKYRAIAMGPVPNNFDGLFQYMENEGYVQVEHNEYANGSIGTRFLPGDQRLTDKILSEPELATLQTVFKRFSRVSSKEIIRISHEEIAWEKNMKEHAIISYLDSYLLKAI